MKNSGDLTLKSINGLSPEKYMKMQDAAEKRVRDKNRKQHLLYAVFVGIIVLLASTQLQYVLVAIISICGWVWLWFSQNIPFGPDDGMPRTRGIPPIFAPLLFLFPVGAIGAASVFIFTLIQQLL
tara:strand:+ start:1759 stop:2133 length:375 start_codon:yes stop_codon:yes gene_type:complete